MDQAALAAAQNEYRSAAASLADMRSSNDFASTERHWTSFLTAANRIFTRLEQGSKASSKSVNWWAKKVHEWRNDELLKYIRHARNVKEHTIQSIAKLHEGSAKLVEPTEQDFQALNKAMQGETRPYIPLGLVEVVWSHCKLLEVVDKGVRYYPPKTHFGMPVIDHTPNSVGTLALEYLEALIKDAERLTA